ncbi:acyltransferase [Aliivibrio finisterrensis]|uniref:Acyltransferase n=1 Tax=Aliivibrio finisterrensis TaxID=511998 RepID=A0A4Q5K8C4_9GAMM|nr:acyltransferase family protein [Aliivibrio finisterrensis]RYU40932.1 acyltransferase [Aliivibrio finisterrensis]
MASLAYRADISGLRAVAVLLVLFFHVGFQTFPGGFVGVDVFFVLSGFLITSIINRDLINHTFTYRDFYLKRIRRILPVLLFVLTTTCIMAWFVMFPGDYERLMQGAGLSFLSFSNFYFNNITDGYWGTKAESIPLLHTWSLSVEEQFYLLWPAIMIGLFAFISQQFHRWILLGATCVLLLLSEYMSIHAPNSAYYLLPARAFELIMGATLALFLPKMRKITPTVNHLLSLIGFTGIICTALTLSKSDVFPGVNAAIVCFSTILILISGKDADNQGVVNRLLSNPALVFIGLISYSLYLWHWPIIGLLNYMAVDKTVPVQFAIISSSILLSIFTYYAIEQKFRSVYIFSFKKTAIIFLAIPFVLLATSIVYVKETNGAAHRFSSQGDTLINTLLSQTYSDCRAPYCSGSFENKFSNRINDADFLVIGDSHAESLEGFVNVLANDANQRGAVLSHGGTPFLIGVERFDIGRDAVQPTFSQKNKDKLDAIKTFAGDTVIITGRYSHYLRENSGDAFYYEGDDTNHATSIRNFKHSFEETIKQILSLNKRLIIVKDVPEFDIDRARCPILGDMLGIELNCMESMPLSDVLEQREVILDFFEHINIIYPEVHFIDMKALSCDSSSCYLERNGVPLYRDSNHINYIGAKTLGEIYLETNKNPL